MHRVDDDWMTFAGATPVPGGWICVVDCSTRVGEDICRPVFVPAPPRLVALESTEGGAVFIEPTGRLMISPAGEGKSFVAIRGAGVASTMTVKGTPAEVAARLGLEVDAPEDDAPCGGCTSRSPDDSDHVCEMGSATGGAS